MIIHVGHIHAPQRNQYSEFGSFDGYIETICFFFFKIADEIALFAGTCACYI